MRPAAPQCISGRTSYLRVRLAFHPYPQLIRDFCNKHRFGPSRSVTNAAAWPWVAHTVSGLLLATIALFTLGFPGAPAVAALTRPREVTRRVILQKARDHRAGRASLRLSLHGRGRFQALFHSPRRGAFHRSLTVLCAIGRCVYVALGSGLPSFTPDCSCPALLKYQSWRSMRVSYPAVTVYGDAFQTSSDTDLINQCTTAVVPDWTYNPGSARPAGLTRIRFGLLPVRSPLLREYFLFLGVHEMFQFPRCPPDQRSGHRC